MNKNYHQLINCYKVIIKPTFHQLNMLITSGFEGIIWVSADIFYILKDRNQIPMSASYLTIVLCINNVKIFRTNRKKCICILSLNRISESGPCKLNLGVKETHLERKEARWAGVEGGGRKGSWGRTKQIASFYIEMVLRIIMC